MRRRPVNPRHLRYVARLRAAGLVADTAFLSRDLSAKITEHARRAGYPRSIVFEAGLSEALRILTPSALQRAAQERKRRIEVPATLLLAPSDE